MYWTFWRLNDALCLGDGRGKEMVWGPLWAPDSTFDWCLGPPRPPNRFQWRLVYGKNAVTPGPSGSLSASHPTNITVHASANAIE